MGRMEGRALAFSRAYWSGLGETFQRSSGPRGAVRRAKKDVQARPWAGPLIKLVAAGPPGGHFQIFDLPGIGGIKPWKEGSTQRAKMSKLPFGGAKYVRAALVRSALCVTEPHGCERASLMHACVREPQ